MTPLVRCKGACGLELPKTEEHFRHYHYARSFPKVHGAWIMELWAETCKACMTSKRVASRRKSFLEQLTAEQPAEIECVKCGLPKVANDDNFPRRRSGAFRTTCRVCLKLWIANYRRTSAWKAYRVRSRSKIREQGRRWAAANPERVRSYKEAWIRKRLSEDPVAEARRVKARGLLRCAIDRGEVVRKGYCERCGPRVKHEHGRRGLRARFLRGPVHYMEVEWLCPPHFWSETHKSVVRNGLEDELEFEVESLEIDPEEWSAIHLRHLVQAESEYGAPDEEYAREVAMYRDRFRKSLNEEARRPRMAPRYADLMLLQAIGG